MDQPAGHRGWDADLGRFTSPDHSRITHSRNRTDLRGHGRTRRHLQLSSGGPLRSRQDTRGHVTKTVRDREAPGSNPGPPTNFEFKVGGFPIGVRSSLTRWSPPPSSTASSTTPQCSISAVAAIACALTKTCHRARTGAYDVVKKRGYRKTQDVRNAGAE